MVSEFVFPKSGSKLLLNYQKLISFFKFHLIFILIIKPFINFVSDLTLNLSFINWLIQFFHLIHLFFHSIIHNIDFIGFLLIY